MLRGISASGPQENGSLLNADSLLKSVQAAEWCRGTHAAHGVLQRVQQRLVPAEHTTVASVPCQIGSGAAAAHRQTTAASCAGLVDAALLLQYQQAAFCAN